MICDDLLSALATGSASQRWRARRHASSCERCRETLAFYERSSRELSNAPPLARQRREAWLRAAEAEPTVTPRRRLGVRRLAIAAVAAAAVLAAVLPALRTAKVGLRPPRDEVPRVAASERAPDAATLRQLDAMRARLDDAERELTELAVRADLLDARHQAESLWVRYAPVREPEAL